MPIKTKAFNYNDLSTLYNMDRNELRKLVAKQADVIRRLEKEIGVERSMRAKLAEIEKPGS